jgi:hypothetical protein
MIAAEVKPENKRWASPTFAQTTDNPPYAGYPALNPNLN